MTQIIGFLSNKLTLRGTEIAMYDYAHFNETLLNNKSIIITRDYENIKDHFDVSLDAYNKFKKRFQVEFYQTQSDIDNIVEKYKLTHLYIIKGGNFDGLYTTKCKNLIHCVFTAYQPHGHVYSVISSDVNRLSNTNYPVVPHMIYNSNNIDNFRKELNIQENAIVFGRYGGLETFDINFVHEVIKLILNIRSDIYFIFMNTYVFHKHNNIIYLDGTSDMNIKKKFINTCDALLHARFGGETFGLTCGEFALELKPVITWNGSKERNHINVLGDKAILYNDITDLFNILINFNKEKYSMENNGFFDYLPEKVIDIFKRVYLE
jgi:hypothetical protein